MGISPISLQRFSDIFINYLLSVKDEIIGIPDSQRQPNLTYKFNGCFYEFNGGVFAIDSTLIKKKRSVVEWITLINCLDNNSIHMMIVFGHGYHNVNKLESTHDSSVFRDSFLYEHLNDGILRENAFTSGDSGYSLLPVLMKPCRIYELSDDDLEKNDQFN